VKVAQSGRVKIKVDAGMDRSPLATSLLVARLRPRYALRACECSGTMIHRPGTLVGKALEPLDQGTVKILVLVDACSKIISSAKTRGCALCHAFCS